MMADPVTPQPSPIPVVQNGPFGWPMAFWTLLITTVGTSIVSIAVAVAGYLINGTINENTKQLKENKDSQSQHAETQIAKQEESIKVQKETKAAALSNVAATRRVETATQAIPVAAVEAAKVVVEQKAEEKKAADSAPDGLK
jgi:hypothetical protein